MSGFLTDAYLWFKALHIIAAMSWMAGLLYLPRLFVYHVEVHAESQEARRFSVMERRLLRAIDRKSTRLNSSHSQQSRMPSSA